MNQFDPPTPSVPTPSPAADRLFAKVFFYGFEVLFREDWKSSPLPRVGDRVVIGGYRYRVLDVELDYDKAEIAVLLGLI